MTVAQFTRKHGISPATYYHWKSKYGGAGVSELKRLILFLAEPTFGLAAEIARNWSSALVPFRWEALAKPFRAPTHRL